MTDGRAPVDHPLDSGGGAADRIVRGGMVRTLGYVVGTLASLISVPLIFRHLGVVGSGRYVTVVTIVGVVGGIVEAGLTGVGIREHALRSKVSGDVLLRDLLGLRLTVALVAGAITVAFMTVAGYERVLVVGAAVVGVGVLVDSAATTYGVWLATTLRLGWLTISQVARQLATVVLALAVVLGEASLFPFFVVFAVAPLAQLAITYAVTRNAIPHLPSIDVRRWWALFRVALPYAAATAAGIVFFRVTVILMSLLAPVEETGYFGAPFRILEVLGGGATFVVGAAFPVLVRAAHSDRTRLGYALQQMFDTSLILGAWLALMTVGGAELAISIIAGPEFEPSVSVLRIQGVAMLDAFLVATWSYALLSLAAYRQLLLANGIALAVAACACILLIPSLGAVGGAIAAVISGIVRTSGYAVALIRGRPELRPSLRVVPPVAAATVLGAAIIAFSALPAMVTLTFASVAYAVVIAASGAIPAEIRAGPLARLTGRRRSSKR